MDLRNLINALIGNIRKESSNYLLGLPCAMTIDLSGLTALTVLVGVTKDDFLDAFWREEPFDDGPKAGVH